MAYMAHSQVPDREAVARLAFLDACYKGVQDPHLNNESRYDLLSHFAFLICSKIIWDS